MVAASRRCGVVLQAGVVADIRRRALTGCSTNSSTSGKKIFLDAKMFDIGETVRQGVARAAERGVDFVTVHGDNDIIQAAAEGKVGSKLKSSWCRY